MTLDGKPGMLIEIDVHPAPCFQFSTTVTSFRATGNRHWRKQSNQLVVAWSFSVNVQSGEVPRLFREKEDARAFLAIPYWVR